MKRRVIAAIIGAAMIVGSLAGCGAAGQTQSTSAGDAEQTQDTQQSENSGAAQEKQDNQEIVEVFWQYPAYGEVSPGFYDVEDALNEMMEKDIGVHVTFVPTQLDTSQQDAILAISAGEQLDVCLSAFVSMSNLVEKGLVIPLDDILKDTGCGAILAEHNADPFAKSTYKGTVYGIPCGDKTYSMYGYIMKKKFAEKYDVMPDDDKIYTMDELEAILDIVKEGEGENVYMNIPWNNTYEPQNYSLCEYDKLGGDLSFGVLMLNRSFDSTEIVDLYETEEYAEFCDRMYRWAQKGFMTSDAAVDTDAITEIATSDKYVGWMAYAAPQLDMLDSGWTDEIVQYKTIDGYVGSTSSSLNWSISINCQNPEKAVEAVTYIYEHPEANWLIQYGIEGDSWIITEQRDGMTAGKYASDDYLSLNYINPYGLWGNVLETPAMNGVAIDQKVRMREYEEQVYASGRVTPAAGYTFDASSVAAEVAAVQTVVASYAPSLNAGALDPEKALPEFISGLKAAGIDKIIAENQRQLDEWKAAQ